MATGLTTADIDRLAQEAVPTASGRLTLPLPLTAQERLSVPAADRPRGELLLPAGIRHTTAIDLTAAYLSLSADFELELPLETIREYLQRLPRDEVIWVLAQIAHRVDRASWWADNRAALQNDLVSQLLPASLQRRARLLLRERGRAITSSQAAVRLALHALIECGRDVPPIDPATLARALGLLMLGVADHFEASVNTDDPADLTLELVRNDIFYRLHGVVDWYDEAFEIVFSVLPSLTRHPDYFSVEDVIGRAFGLGLLDFWCLTAATGLLAGGSADTPRFPVSLERGRVDADVIRRWERAWSILADDATALAAGDLASGSTWSFTAFYERPILILREDLRFAVRSHYLVEKASPTGVFWAVARARRELGLHYEPWSRLFGAAVEERGRALVVRHVEDPSRILTESQLTARWSGARAQKVCDLIAIYPDAWIAFEFVHRNLTRATQADGAYRDLIIDIERAVVEKLVQIDDSLARLFAEADPPRPARVFPVVVIGAAFPANPLVAIAVSDLLNRAGMSVIGVDPQCRRPSVIDLFELRYLLAVARSSATFVPDLLEAWLASELGSSSFRNWLATDGPGVPRGDSDPGWMRDVSACLFSSDDT